MTETLTITIKTPVDVVVPYVTVRILDGSGVLVTSGTTDGYGQVVFSLEAGSYQVWYNRAGYEEEDVTAFTITGTLALPLVLTPLTTQALCWLYGNFMFPDGRPINRLRVEVKLDVETYGSVMSYGSLVTGTVIYFTDSRGELGINLVRNVEYMIRFSSRSDVFYRFTCPDLAQANILNYVFPFVEELNFAESSYALSVGESASVTFDCVMSDGEIESQASGITIESDDEAVVTVSGRTITAIAAGTATLSITDVDDTLLPSQQDMLEAGLITLPTPTYTVGSDIVVTVS